MQIYKAMYLRLFNAVTDAIEALRVGQPFQARDLLIAAQQETEEMFLSAEDE